MSSQTPGVASIQADTAGGESPDRGEMTAVGVDVGVRHLYAAAPGTAGDEIEDATVLGGDHIRRRLDTLAEATGALQATRFDTTEAEAQVFAAVWGQLYGQLHSAAARVLEYVQEHPAPVVVLEDLPYTGFTLWERRLADKPGVWLLPTLQDVLSFRAATAGVPVVFVDPEYTTQQCHLCGKLAHMENETIQCTTADCPVGEVCRDKSAAVSIARRAFDGDPTEVEHVMTGPTENDTESDEDVPGLSVEREGVLYGGYPQDQPGDTDVDIERSED